MSRRILATLLSALLSASSFAAPIESARVVAPVAIVNTGAASSVTGLDARRVSLLGGSALVSPLATHDASVRLTAPLPALAGTAPAAPLGPATRSILSYGSVVTPAAPAPQPVEGDRYGAVNDNNPRTERGVAERVARVSRDWGVPVESIFKDRDVLLIGEDHGSLSTIETLAREMPRLAKAGVTAVGIEGLKKHNQQAVDAYVKGRTDTMPIAVLGFSPARMEAFAGLFKAARDNGVRVVALGLPLDTWAAMVAQRAQELNTDMDEHPGTDLVHQVDRAERRYEYGFNEAVAEVVLTRRNKVMADLLKNALVAGGKAVIVAGQAHVPGPDHIAASRFHVAGDYGNLATELGSLALRAYSLTFTGGLFTSVQAARDDQEVRPAAHAAVIKAAPGGAPTFLPLGPDQGLWHAGGTVSRVTTH